MRRRASVTGSRMSPISSCTGSPGARRPTTNTTTLLTTRISSMKPRRRAANRITVQPPGAWIRRAEPERWAGGRVLLPSRPGSFGGPRGTLGSHGADVQRSSRLRASLRVDPAWWADADARGTRRPAATRPSLPVTARFSRGGAKAVKARRHASVRENAGIARARAEKLTPSHRRSSVPASMTAASISLWRCGAPCLGRLERRST